MQHLLLSFTYPSLVYNDRFIFNTLLGACNKAGCSVCATTKHEFYPQGFSAAVLIGESHVTVHSWPEKNILFVDYFSCADNPRFEDFITVWSEFGFRITDKQIINRK